MERYTYFDSGKFRLKIDDTEYSGDWVDRLSAYEETGLEPEDMKRAFNEDAILKLAGQALGMSPDRLRELAQAEKTGRLVVLPCKDWFEIVFGEQELFWGIDTDYIETPIREISVDNAERFTWYDGWKTLVLRGNDENGLDWEFSPEDVGKTVFLTREAAEAALKEREAIQNVLDKQDNG